MKAANFKVGDLIRALDYANANTVYRVLEAYKKKGYPGYSWRYKIQGVLGLFKSEFKTKKDIGNGSGYERVDLLDLASARNQLDLFIQKEAKRLSGEDIDAHEQTHE